MLISFEGIDGCGKSTQIELLKEYLNNQNLSFSIFREPGGTVISEKIRTLLLHDSNEMNAVTELLLFSAARSQLITEKVIPLLKKGEIVILDRYFDSTTAYQGYGRQSAALNSIKNLNRLASHQAVPDLTFYLKIDPTEAAKRTEKLDKDRMERAGLEFFSRVSSGYDTLAESELRFFTIDAKLKREVIHKKIVNEIKNFLSKEESD